MYSPKKRLFYHLLYWFALFLLYLKLGHAISADWEAVIEIYFGKIIIQVIAAYVLVYVFIPKYLNKNRHIYFFASLFAWSYFIYVLMVMTRAIYLEPKFYDFFKLSHKHYTQTHIGVWDRIFNMNEFLDAVPWLFTPAAFMGLIKFYRNQLNLTKIENEKRTLELNMLKNQLNPHFLFNTLNNLYFLTIKKDDKAVEVIEKLSEILDYILYRCNESKVPVHKEIKLLENYIDIEKIRYGKNKLCVSFVKNIDDNQPVPPLIFMTLLENAFKHGVMNESKQAFIMIHLIRSNHQFLFSIENTKPSDAVKSNTEKKGIGLVNVRKQLDLIYTNSYCLELTETENSFKIILTVDEV